MKNKLLTTILVGSLVLAPLTMSFAGCGATAKVYAADRQEVYVFSAMSSVMYLSGSDSSGGGVSSMSTIAAVARPSVLESEIPKINGYLGMFDDYLSNDGYTPVESTPTVDDGEYASYTTKLVISIPNSAGSPETYTMYYTETSSETETEEEDGVIEEETETTLKGVVIYGDKAFDVHGERSVEISGKDIEVEIKFTTKSKANPADYIVIEQEMEKDEIEFQYSIYEMGALKSRAKIEREDEDGAKELSMQFIDKSSGQKSNMKYDIKESVIGADKVFMVKYKNNGVVEHFTIKDLGDRYQYTYNNGYVEELRKA